MNNPSPSVSSSSAASASPKVIQTNNKDPGELVTINEKINLTKKQHEANPPRGSPRLGFLFTTS